MATSGGHAKPRYTDSPVGCSSNRASSTMEEMSSSPNLESKLHPTDSDHDADPEAITTNTTQRSRLKTGLLVFAYVPTSEHFMMSISSLLT